MVNPLLKASKRQPLAAGGDSEQQGLLSQIGSATLSGLSRIANFANLPGSSVLDVLGGENPLDQWTPGHLTTSDNRLSGRDVLRKHGLIGKKDTWGNFAAGFALDVATDPFTFLGPGALTKAASSGIKGLGAAAKVSQAAKQGGGLLSVGVPFINSATTEVLTGPTAIKYADSLRKAAEWTGTSYPMRTALAALSSKKMGRSTPEGQQIATNIFDRQTQGQQGVRAFTTDIARTLEKTGRATPAGGAALRREIETGIPAGLPVSPEATKLADMFATTKTESTFAGLKSQALDDDLGYAFRQLNENLLDSPSSDKLHGPFAGSSSKDAARLQLLKDFKLGTEGINKLFDDQAFKGKVNNWRQQIETARQAGNTPKAIRAFAKQANQDLTQHITQHHGANIKQTFQPVNKSGLKLWQDAGGKKLWSRTQPQGATAILKDRYQGLASLALDNPKWFEHTPFPNNPVVDAEVYAMSHRNRIDAALTIYEHVAKLAQPGSQMSLSESTPLGKLFKRLGVNGETAAQRVAEHLGMPWSKQAGKDVRSMRISKEVAADLLGKWPSYQVPKNTGLLLNTVDSMQALWKAGMLSWPATITRNATSGAIQNILKGWLDINSFVDAHKLAQGQTIKNLTNIREIRDWLSAHNLPITDEHATEGLRQLYASHQGGHHIATDVATAGATVDPGIEAMLRRVPGRKPSSAAESIKRVAATTLGMEPGTTRNPLDVRGFKNPLNPKSKTKTTSTFGPAAASDMLNEYVDTLSRAAPLIYRLRKGHSAADAMREITAAQVDYSPRAFTADERSILKRVFPFYSYTKSQLHWVAHELLTNPGGRLRQTIRATAAARGNDPGMPDYVGETAAIPLGQSPDGTKRFITGFGLMHEDPLSFLGSPQEALLEAASRSNPLIKAPLEFATGQSFFQRGPNGGRALGDMDPTIGRTLANIGNLTGLRESQDAVRLPFGGIVEHLAANSPVSRVFTTARTLTDTRKDALTKAANLLTGGRIADISPAAQDRATLEKALALLRESGGRTFTDVSVPQDRLAAMNPAQRSLVEKLNELKQAIAARRRERQMSAAQ